jgi:peptidyl-prolyl cis-trans isomerase D
MLEQIREFAQRRFVRWAFAAFLIVVFGLFGIDSYMNSPAGGNAVATVGPHRIGQVEYDNALRRQTELYRQQFGANFDATIMDNPEIRKSVLDRLVAESLLGLGAERAGVKIGDKELARRITAETGFFDADGKFSRQMYEAAAKNNGFTVVGLDERLREEYRRLAFRESITETAIVPRSLLDSFIRLTEQSREVSQITLPPEPLLAKVKVTPEQVRAYYEAHKAEFTIPESIRAEYLELSTESLAAQTPVDPEDAKRFYESNASRWGQREERKASHILLTVKPDASDAEKKSVAAKAQALADQVRKAPATFADVAKKESQDPGSAVQGGDLGFFPRGAMVKEFDAAVYAAKKGDIVGPVQSEFGWHVILVTDVKPEKMRSLAEAMPEIEAELKKQGAARRFAEMAENFANVVYEQPASLKPAADLLKLNVQASGWFSKAFGAPPAIANPKLLAELFSDDAVKAKRNTAAIEVRPSVLVSARVLEHKPSELRPLESVQADIQRRLQREEALKLAQDEGEEKLKALREGKDAGLAWPAPLAVSRQKPGGLFPQVLDEVFRADARKVPAFIGVATPAGYSLVKLSKAIELEKIDDAKREGLGTQLRSAVAAQDLEASLASVRNKVGVNVRKDAFEKKEDEGPRSSSAPPKPRPPSKFGGLGGN